MAPSRRGLVGPRSDWTPEEVARYEVALCSGLSRDKKAQRVYLAKLRVTESVRAKGVAAMSLSGGIAPDASHTGAAAGGRSSGSTGSPDGAAAKSRARRQKSDVQRQKSGEKLQHKWLQRRCEAAATKTGGLPPKILGRVLACCGRFLELLHPEGAEMMERLRQAEAQSVAPMDATDTGLEAMRRALKATQDAAHGPPEKKKKPAGEWVIMETCGCGRFHPHSRDPRQCPNRRTEKVWRSAPDPEANAREDAYREKLFRDHGGITTFPVVTGRW
tara:strand:+ start:154 stop:975 length:822 start_codon:yes stop_codon:yes gene_type:complete